MEEKRTGFRLEHDSIGDKQVPKEAYYGVQSLRAKENFHITGHGMHPQLIIAVAHGCSENAGQFQLPQRGQHPFL